MELQQADGKGDGAVNLDSMTWEERFWVAFEAVIELEKRIETSKGGSGLILCPRCCERSIAIIRGGLKARSNPGYKPRAPKSKKPHPKVA
jgi:hypothetical protein